MNILLLVFHKYRKPSKCAMKNHATIGRSFSRGAGSRAEQQAITSISLKDSSQRSSIKGDGSIHLALIVSQNLPDRKRLLRPSEIYSVSLFPSIRNDFNNPIMSSISQTHKIRPNYVTSYLYSGCPQSPCTYLYTGCILLSLFEESVLYGEMIPETLSISRVYRYFPFVFQKSSIRFECDNRHIINTLIHLDTKIYLLQKYDTIATIRN